MQSTRTAPKRSATAPANGWPKPHSRFWIASASEKASRPQPRSNDSGDRNWPSDERGPKESNAIAQPTAISTAGVRQEASFNDAGATDISTSGQVRANSQSEPSSESAAEPSLGNIADSVRGAKAKVGDDFDLPGAWLLPGHQI